MNSSPSLFPVPPRGGVFLIARRAGALAILVLLSAAPLIATAESELKLIQLKHRTAEDIVPILQPLLGRDGAVTGQGYQLIVRAPAPRLREIERVVQELDAPRRNLRITVQYAGAQADSGGGQGLAGESRVGDHGRIVVGERKPKDSGGLSVGRRDGDSSLRYQVERRSSTHREDTTQFVQVLDGQRAFIQVGQALPEVQTFLTIAGNYVTLTQGVQYRNVTTGFDVLPRLRGDAVLLEITPRLAFLTNQGTQIVNFQELNTTVQTRLGEWVQLGASVRAGDEVSRRILRTWRTGASEERTIRLKVEAL